MKIEHKLVFSDEGKTRTRFRFAYFPVRLTDGDLIWFDSYTHVEEVCADSKKTFLWWATVSKELYKVSEEE